MRLRICSLLVLLPACAALAGVQLDSDSITITASRALPAPVEQVVFNVSVVSGTNVTFEGVLGALSGTGITAANLTAITTLFGAAGVGASPLQPQQSWQWTFALAVPLSSIPGTISALTTAAQTVQQNQSGLSVSFIILGSQSTAPEASTPSCPLADLFADARAQAQKVAATAGLTAGSVLALSDGSEPFNFVSIPALVNRDFGAVLPNPFFGFSSFLLGAPPVPSTCSMTVKFALGPG